MTSHALQWCAGRREILLGGGVSVLTILGAPAWAAEDGYRPADIRLDLAPDQSKYDAGDEDLRDAAGRLQLALNAENVKVHPSLLPSSTSLTCLSASIPGFTSCLESSADSG